MFWSCLLPSRCCFTGKVLFISVRWSQTMAVAVFLQHGFIVRVQALNWPDAVQKPKDAAEQLVSCSKHVSLLPKNRWSSLVGNSFLKLLVAAIKFKMNKSNSLVSAFAAVLFSVLLHCFYLESQSTPVLLKSRNNLLILSFKLSSGCFFYFEWSLTEFLCVNRWKHWWLPRCVKMISGTCLSGVVQIVNTFY